MSPRSIFTDEFGRELAPLRATHDIVLVDQRGTGGSGAVGCRSLELRRRLREEARRQASVPDDRRDRARPRGPARRAGCRAPHAARRLLRHQGRGRVRAPLPGPDGGADPRFARRRRALGRRRTGRHRRDAAHAARGLRDRTVRAHRRRTPGAALFAAVRRVRRRPVRGRGRAGAGRADGGRERDHRRAAGLLRTPVRGRVRDAARRPARRPAVARARRRRPVHPRCATSTSADTRGARGRADAFSPVALPGHDLPRGAGSRGRRTRRSRPARRPTTRTSPRSARAVRAVPRRHGTPARRGGHVRELARDARARAAAGRDPDVPVLVLSGRDDLRTPLEQAQRVAAAYPRATVLDVPHVGHSVLTASSCARAAVAAFLAGGDDAAVRRRRRCARRPTCRPRYAAKRRSRRPRSTASAATSRPRARSALPRARYTVGPAQRLHTRDPRAARAPGRRVDPPRPRLGPSERRRQRPAHAQRRGPRHRCGAPVRGEAVESTCSASPPCSRSPCCSLPPRPCRRGGAAGALPRTGRRAPDWYPRRVRRHHASGRELRARDE